MAGNLSLGISIGASVAPSVGRAFSSVEDQAKQVGSALRQAWSKRDMAGNVIHYRNTLQELKKKQSQLGYSSERLNQGIAEVEQKYREAKSQAREYGLSVGNIVQEHRQLADSAEVAERRMGRLQTQQANREKREQLQGQVMGTAGAAVAAAAPIRSAMKFEESMADVKKVVDFDKPEQFKAMGQDILEMSGRMPMAAQGISDIVAAAGQSGIAQDQLQSFAQSAVKMGTAFDMTGREAGKMMADWRAGMGLTQKKTVALADAVNHLSNNMNAEATALGEVVQREGAAAKAAGLAAQETAALGAALLSSGTSPERASTALKKLTGSLTAGEAATKRQREAFQALGMDAQTLAQRMQEDAQGTITEVFERIQGMDKARQGSMIKQIFGAESKSAIMPLLGQLDQLKKAQGLVAEEAKYAGSMQAEYEERVGTTSAQMEMFTGKINALGVTLGSVLLPALNNVMGVVGSGVEVVTDLAEQFPVLTQAVIGAGVGLVGFKVAALGGKYAATFLSDGLQVGRAAFDLLRPSTVRTTLALWRYRASVWGAAVATKAMAGWSGVKALGSSLASLASRAIPTVIAGLRSMTVALMTNPIGAIVGGIALAAGMIYKYWEPIGAFFRGVWSGIREGAAPVFEALAPLAPLGKIIGSVVGWLADKVGALAGWLGGLLSPAEKTKSELKSVASAGQMVGEAIGLGIRVATAPIRFIVGLIGWAAEGFSGFKEKASSAVGSTVSVVSAAWDGLKTIVSWSPLGLLARAWEPITGWFGRIASAPGDALGAAWDGLKTIVSWSPLGMLARAWGPVTNLFANLGDGIKTVLGGLWGWVKRQILAPIDAVMDKVGSAWETVKGWFGGGDEEKTTKVREKLEKTRDGAAKVGKAAATGTAIGASAASPAAAQPPGSTSEAPAPAVGEAKKGAEVVGKTVADSETAAAPYQTAQPAGNRAGTVAAGTTIGGAPASPAAAPPASTLGSTQKGAQGVGKTVADAGSDAGPPPIAGSPGGRTASPYKDSQPAQADRSGNVINVGDVTINVDPVSGDPEEIAERVRDQLAQMNHRVNSDA